MQIKTCLNTDFLYRDDQGKKSSKIDISGSNCFFKSTYCCHILEVSKYALSRVGCLGVSPFTMPEILALFFIFISGFRCLNEKQISANNLSFLLVREAQYKNKLKMPL